MHENRYDVSYLKIDEVAKYIVWLNTQFRKHLITWIAGR